MRQRLDLRAWSSTTGVVFLETQLGEADVGSTVVPRQNLTLVPREARMSSWPPFRLPDRWVSQWVVSPGRWEGSVKPNFRSLISIADDLREEHVSIWLRAAIDYTLKEANPTTITNNSIVCLEVAERLKVLPYGSTPQHMTSELLVR